MNITCLSLNRASTLASTVLCTVYGMDGRCRVRYGSSVGKEHKWKTNTPSCSAEFSSSEVCSDLIWWFGFNLPEIMKDTVTKRYIVNNINQHLRNYFLGWSLLPSATVAAERLCFHRRLSVHRVGARCTPPWADTLPRWLLLRTVRILLECILVKEITCQIIMSCHD